MTTQEKVFEATGLNWSVTKLPLFTANQTPTESFDQMSNMGFDEIMKWVEERTHEPVLI